MKRVLFVLGEYINRTAQNGLCIDDIRSCMESYGTRIDVLCIERKKIASTSKQDNVYTVVSKDHGSRFSNIIRKCIKFLYMPIGSYMLVVTLMKEISRLDSLNSYDSIISVVNPTESAEAVFRYKKKNKNFKFILYEIDPASNRYKNPKGLLQTLWKKKSIQWEKKIYTYADKIIHMKSHAIHFSGYEYKTFEDKVCYLDIPSLKPLNIKASVNFNKSVLSFIYAGAFYPVLREPDYMIDLLSILSENIKIRVDIFTGNNMIEHLKKLIHENNDKIILRNLIPQVELNKCIDKADVLLSIGNCDSDFLPSKTLYYIGTGKPIIHFYSDESDVSNFYLEKYPFALLVDQRKCVHKNIDSILNFINNIKTNEMPEINLHETFTENTPEYSAKKIMELIW